MRYRHHGFPGLGFGALLRLEFVSKHRTLPRGSGRILAFGDGLGRSPIQGYGGSQQPGILSFRGRISGIAVALGSFVVQKSLDGLGQPGSIHGLPAPVRGPFGGLGGGHVGGLFGGRGGSRNLVADYPIVFDGLAVAFEFPSWGTDHFPGATVLDLGQTSFGLDGAGCFGPALGADNLVAGAVGPRIRVFNPLVVVFGSGYPGPVLEQCLDPSFHRPGPGAGFFFFVGGFGPVDHAGLGLRDGCWRC